MPRAKPRRQPTGWIVAPLKLPNTEATQEAKETLMRLAGLDNGLAWRRLWTAVRERLELYPGLATNGLPRPANQRAALQRIDDGTSSSPLAQLRTAIDALDCLTHDLLHAVPGETRTGGQVGWLDGDVLVTEARPPRTLPAVNLMDVRRHLDALHRAIIVVDRSLQDRESRGAAPNDARRAVLAMLAAAFQSEESGDADDYLERLCDFLIHACDLGGVALPRRDRVLDLLPPSTKVPRETLSHP